MARGKKTVKIAEWAKAILRNAEVGPVAIPRSFGADCTVVRIRELLHRPDYLAIAKILRALGGKWDRREEGHVFLSDAQVLLDEAVGTGEAVDQKRSLEQFDTPEELARLMVERAEIEEGDNILEPSAGVGNLVRAVYAHVTDEVARSLSISMVEIDPKRCEQLVATFKDRPIDVACDDFCQMEDENWAMAHELFNVVLMNPPFSRNQDIDHIRLAWDYLAPKGRLVALCSTHSWGNSDKEIQFAAWLQKIGAEFYQTSAGLFAEAGTQTRVILISARKPEIAYTPWVPRSRRRRQKEPGPLLARMGLE
jgi:predicted RNA methylase